MQLISDLLSVIRRPASSFLPIVVSIMVLVSCNEEEPELIYESQINQWQYINHQHGMVSDFVNTIFEDSKGNFWIGTNRGISVLSGNTFTTYTVAHGLLDNNVYAIAEDRDGKIWVGTPRGINVLSDDRWQYVGYFYGAPVYALLALEDDGGILIGTGGYGIYRFEYGNNNFSLFNYIDDCLGCNSINSLFQSKDGSVWIASFEGARRLRGNFITKFDIKDGLSGNIATTISEDSWGNIWIGTVEGKTISKISGNSVSQVTFNNGADQNFIFGIQEDNNGDLWVGTVRNGLFLYDGAIMKKVQEGPANTITSMLKDTRGNLWIGTDDGGVAIYITNPNP